MNKYTLIFLTVFLSIATSTDCAFGTAGNLSTTEAGSGSSKSSMECTEQSPVPATESLDSDKPGTAKEGTGSTVTADCAGLISMSSEPPHSNAALDEVPVDAARAESITNETLGKIIELLRLNTVFRLSTTDKSRIKPWRIFAYNLAGSGAATAGLIYISAERWRTWKEPATARKDRLLAGPTLLLISHSIMATGVVTEALLDILNDHKKRKQSLDAKSILKKAKSLCKEIDLKLTEREALVSKLGSLSEADRTALISEGLVLKDLRSLALQEYSQFHVRSKRRIASRNASYINGFLAATTGGFGALTGVLAVTEKNPRLVGPGGIGFVVSGMNITTGPVVGRSVGNVSASLTRKRLKRELPATEPAQLQEHLATLRKASSPDDIALSRRLADYQEIDEILKRQAKMTQAEKSKADREFIERCLSNAAVGGTKMAWGIQLINAGYGFRKPPAAPAKTDTVAVDTGGFKPKTPPQLFAKRVAYGATTFLTGTSIWMLDTLQARTRGELDVYNMGQQAALPHQKLKDRMNRLEKMESDLKESK